MKNLKLCSPHNCCLQLACVNCASFSRHETTQTPAVPSPCVQGQPGERGDVLVNVVSPCCSLFVNTEEEYIPDSESVRQQRELHHQPQTCTLSQCFQLYTKEEQVDTHSVLWLVHMLQELPHSRAALFC